MLPLGQPRQGQGGGLDIGAAGGNLPVVRHPVAPAVHKDVKDEVGVAARQNQSIVVDHRKLQGVIPSFSGGNREVLPHPLIAPVGAPAPGSLILVPSALLLGVPQIRPPHPRQQGVNRVDPVLGIGDLLGLLGNQLLCICNLNQQGIPRRNEGVPILDRCGQLIFQLGQAQQQRGQMLLNHRQLCFAVAECPLQGASLSQKVIPLSLGIGLILKQLINPG